jgi:hypothetical protein
LPSREQTDSQRFNAASGIDRRHILAAVAVVALAAAALRGLGRVAICKCGYVKLWHGVVFSSENSQHLTDWYTFSHVLHGFAFYALLWLVARRSSVGWRFVMATALEAAWEVFENTDFIINRYRAVTISLDYFGDSVINSVSDIAAMMIGFVVAWRAPWWLTAAAALALELFLLYFIRDSLTLNILMLLHPIDGIRQWQSGG